MITISKKKIEDSILFFALKYELYDNYKYLIKRRVSLHELLKLIVYEMFLNNYNVIKEVTSSKEEIENYKTLLTFAKLYNSGKEFILK